MIDFDDFFPSSSDDENKEHNFVNYKFDVSILESYLKGEMISPTWDHNKSESLYASASKTKKWKNMHPNQAMSFCKCGRIALQNINRKYGKGMDIAAYHFPGIKKNCIRKGYNWDSGL